jgi:hypothetical protein
MNNAKRVFKWWTAWKPEIIENWLEDMESQGWHLSRIQWNATWFHFEKGEPRKMRYCADYQTKKDLNYMRICKDSGWDCMYSGVGWYVWKMPYSGGARPEMYSDLDSLIERNKRLMGLFSVVTAVQIPSIVINLAFIRSHSFLILLYAGLIGLLIYATLRLNMTNRELKEKRNRAE